MKKIIKITALFALVMSSCEHKVNKLTLQSQVISVDYNSSDIINQFANSLNKKNLQEYKTNKKQAIFNNSTCSCTIANVTSIRRNNNLIYPYTISVKFITTGLQFIDFGRKNTTQRVSSGSCQYYIDDKFNLQGYALYQDGSSRPEYSLNSERDFLKRNWKDQINDTMILKNLQNLNKKDMERRKKIYYYDLHVQESDKLIIQILTKVRNKAMLSQYQKSQENNRSSSSDF